jgi:hypothetical protein
MLISNELQNEPGNCEDSELLMTHFRTDMGLIFKQSITTIAKSFDDCFFGVSEISSTNKALYSYKMKEVDALFDTIVTSFYKNKVLNMIPDLVFTLETNRLSKAAIISQNLLGAKHKNDLKKGLDALRRNVSRFYIMQGKMNILTNIDKHEEQLKSQGHAIKWISKIIQRKQQLHIINSYSTIQKYVFYQKDDQRQKDYEHK